MLSGGANLLQAHNIIKYKTPVSAKVQQVVVAFDINNRDEGSLTRIRRMIQRLLEAAAQTFPEAWVYIPKINHHKGLLRRQVNNLEMINDCIEEVGHGIPLLPGELFKTEGDKLHWRPQTAAAIFAYWLEHLHSK